ncbi:MAG: DUF480 domain-containing protein [Ignavibacteria bacterium]|nr:DUF480 domain-containing protein [Ignavibacteria bacterium]
MSNLILTFEETRIIGALIEKEFTTPEYYPLTINYLKNACNQKSSRNPVVNFDERLIEKVLNKLRDKSLATLVESRDSRVPKFRQNFSNSLELSQQETAVLCVLMLRGPQTPGEIKGRSGRMFEFESLLQVDEVISELMKRENPMVVKLPKLPGTKESRYMHLLNGEPNLDFYTQEDENLCENLDKISELTAEIENLKTELQQLRTEFEQFKNQF